MKNNFKPHPKMADIVKQGADVMAEPRPETEPELVDMELTIQDFEKKQVQQIEETPFAEYKYREPEIFPETSSGEIREKKKEGISILSKRTVIIFTFLSLFSLFMVLYFVLPKAEITLFLNEEEVSQNFKITADKNIANINVSLNKIPAKELLIQDRAEGEFKTTTEKEISQKAKGKITIYNQYSSSPQTLVASTRFLSSNNKIFRITQNIAVPGAKIEGGRVIASSIETEVVADEPGEDYNIGPAKFSIPGFQGTAKEQGFWGESNQAMGGGMKGKFKIVTEEDINKAKEALLPQLEEKITKNLSEQISSDLERGTGEEKTIEMKSSPNRGEKADKFTLSLTGRVRILSANKKDIEGLIAQRAIQNKIKTEEAPKFEIKKQQIDYLKKESDFKKEQISIEINSISTVIPLFSVSELKTEIKGQNRETLTQIFDRSEIIEKVKVILWPFWVKKVPQDDKRIKIIID